MPVVPLSDLLEHYAVFIDVEGLPRLYCDRCGTWGGASSPALLTDVVAEAERHEAGVHTLAAPGCLTLARG
jgi:hypothetical protein